MVDFFIFGVGLILLCVLWSVAMLVVTGFDLCDAFCFLRCVEMCCVWLCFCDELCNVYVVCCKGGVQLASWGSSPVIWDRSWRGPVNFAET